MQMRYAYAGLAFGQISSQLFMTGVTLPSIFAALGCILGMAVFQLHREIAPAAVDMRVLRAATQALLLLIIGSLLDGVVTTALDEPALSMFFRMTQGYGMAQLVYAIMLHQKAKTRERVVGRFLKEAAKAQQPDKLS